MPTEDSGFHHPSSWSISSKWVSIFQKLWSHRLSDATLEDQESTADPSKDQLRLAPGEPQPPVLHYMEISNCEGTRETEGPKFFIQDWSQLPQPQYLEKKILKEEK